MYFNPSHIIFMDIKFWTLILILSWNNNSYKYLIIIAFYSSNMLYIKDKCSTKGIENIPVKYKNRKLLKFR